MYSGVFSVDDMMHVIYRWKSTNCSWENLMLTILMTIEFVRHCANGRMGLDYIRQLFEGLSTVILRLGQAVSKLASWVSNSLLKFLPRPNMLNYSQVFGFGSKPLFYQ